MQVGKYKRTEKHREEIRQRMLNRIYLKGEKSPLWKGDSVSYEAVHRMIHRQFGKAYHCERCDEKGKTYQWSNNSGKYKRTRSDWEQLCIACHRKKDKLIPGAKKKFEEIYVKMKLLC